MSFMVVAIEGRDGHDEGRETVGNIQRYLRGVTGIDTTQIPVVFEKTREEESSRAGAISIDQAALLSRDLFKTAASLRGNAVSIGYKHAGEVISKQSNIEKLYFDVVSYVNDELFGALCTYRHLESGSEELRHEKNFERFMKAMIKVDAQDHIKVLEKENPGFAKTFDSDIAAKEAGEAIRKSAKFEDGENEYFDENMMGYLMKKHVKMPKGLSQEGAEAYWFLVGDTISLAMLGHRSHVEQFLEDCTNSLKLIEGDALTVLRLKPETDDEDEENSKE